MKSSRSSYLKRLWWLHSRIRSPIRPRGQLKINMRFEYFWKFEMLLFLSPSANIFIYKYTWADKISDICLSDKIQTKRKLRETNEHSRRTPAHELVLFLSFISLLLIYPMGDLGETDQNLVMFQKEDDTFLMSQRRHNCEPHISLWVITTHHYDQQLLCKTNWLRVSPQAAVWWSPAERQRGWRWPLRRWDKKSLPPALHASPL